MQNTHVGRHADKNTDVARIGQSRSVYKVVFNADVDVGVGFVIPRTYGAADTNCGRADVFEGTFADEKSFGTH